MKKPLCVLLGIGFLAWCGGREPQVDRVIENGVELVLNHLEPYKLKGQPYHLRLEEEISIDFEKEEYSGLGLKEPTFAEADAQGNIYVVESYPDSDFFIHHARKPQAFKPGDEWHPGTEPALGWRSGGKSGIIWLWPDMPRDPIPDTSFSTTWCGFQNIESGCCEAK